jgi:hypothetical protein
MVLHSNTPKEPEMTGKLFFDNDQLALEKRSASLPA